MDILQKPCCHCPNPLKRVSHVLAKPALTMHLPRSPSLRISRISNPERFVVAIYAFALAFPLLSGAMMQIPLLGPAILQSFPGQFLLSILIIRDSLAPKHHVLRSAPFHTALTRIAPFAANPGSSHTLTLSALDILRRDRLTILLSRCIIFPMVQISSCLGPVVHCFRFHHRLRSIRSVNGGFDINCLLDLRHGNQPPHSTPALAMQKRILQPCRIDVCSERSRMLPKPSCTKTQKELSLKKITH